MNKINETLKNLVGELIELQEYEAKNDFDTREGKICADIKVYDWFDEDDVINYIDKEHSNFDKEDILQEFNEDRLNSIHNHTCENELSFLKEKYEDNCDVSDFNKIFRVWHRANNTENRDINFYLELYPKDKYYTQQYWSKAKEFKTFKAWEKFIIKNNLKDYTEWLKRSKIDKFECYQYGRSGGWLSICDTNEIDYSDVIYNNFGYWLGDLTSIDNDKEFNLRLKEEGENKKDLIANIRLVLKDAKEKIEAITQIIEDIEEEKKHFKSSLIEQLHSEINEYIFENPAQTNCTIKIDNDVIKTSLGVIVSKEEFQINLKDLLPQFKAMVAEGETIQIKRKVGNYFVERATKIADDIIIKAGCHRFSLNNILSVCG